MLEKGEGFAVGVFPEGLVLLLVNFTDIRISHRAQQGDSYGVFVRDM